MRSLTAASTNNVKHLIRHKPLPVILSQHKRVIELEWVRFTFQQHLTVNHNNYVGHGRWIGKVGDDWLTIYRVGLEHRLGKL